MNIFKVIIRSILVVIAAFVMTIVFVMAVVGTSATKFINWVFNKHSYWDISNEWFQYKQEMRNWYKTFLGKDEGDW